MDCKDRSGNVYQHNDTQDKLLQKLYQTVLGRLCLKVLIHPQVSKAGGWLLNQPISRLAVEPFVKANHINLDDYEKKHFSSYNDFFIRRIRSGLRPICPDRNALIAPCDSKLSVYPITQDGRFWIKHTPYTMEQLTHSRKIAQYFQGGVLCIFRLTVDDYHHFCYVDSGKKSRNYRISGVLHTVNPVANDEYSIYKENTREFSLLKSENFGMILMMEVGALLVGKIVNLHEEENVCRGEEKGWFEFGGSTVILAFRQGMVHMDEDICRNTRDGFETIVKMGEKIGDARK
jgi:phosphatidylserine decarboxylase